MKTEQKVRIEWEAPGGYGKRQKDLDQDGLTRDRTYSFTDNMRKVWEF